MKKLAIIGASYLQVPVIEKAKERNIETHVFAWECNDVGEKLADCFYPISIVEKDRILEVCRSLQIDGICSIASDLAAVTVSYVAEQMGLAGNPMSCIEKATNKHLMRECFAACGDPSPKSVCVESAEELKKGELRYPLIVKPVDRSGSRGVFRIESPEGLSEAIEAAKAVGFEKKAVVEEFARGQEYSVECISWEGEHEFLALTRKYTTGAPNFIETGHLEPADVTDETLSRIRAVVFHALTSLGIRCGASHSEIKIDADGTINIIEIGPRMGGDLIGSSLVELSTGYDFVNAVIDVALGIRPAYQKTRKESAAIRYIFNRGDTDILEQIRKTAPECLLMEHHEPVTDASVTDSSNRFGFFLLHAKDPAQLLAWMPQES